MRTCVFVIAACPLLAAAPLHSAEPPDPADPTKVDADYAIQGEYVGDLETDRWGVQIVALGEGRFATVGSVGGLPGDGWNGDRDALVLGTGETKDGKVAFTAGNGRFAGTIDKGMLTVTEGGAVDLGQFKRVVRKSPTEGMAPPAGATVLFDGKSLDPWKEGAKMTADGLLLAGATSKATFQSFTLHLEFRTPYKPRARGQERGNSGVYPQGRYEVQVLDSFGLKGENNEAGGIYGVKAPTVNMCFPPLQWQTYDIEFTAAVFGPDGKKTHNARMTVRHNGVEVQSKTEIDHATTAAPLAEGPASGPIYLQDHGNPVRFRNIWILPKGQD
jgi:3-keto-disaccharide hydrolase